ncbi:MAG TPA: HD-GYP domain-containing protein [Candidatus Acidoferrales bacterium]
MKNKFLSRLSGVSKELWLILSIVASAGVFNYFVGGQRLILTFYNIPTFFAAYYFGRRRAVEAALGSILFVTWVDMMNPALFGRHAAAMDNLLTSSDLVIWAGLLLVFAYASGTLHETAQRRLDELRQTYTGLLQILSQIISNDKFTQNHSYRVSVYATQIAGEMGFSPDRIEDIRAAALLHDIGKLELSRDVLYKAAKLNANDVKEIRTHVDKGMNFLSPVAGSLSRILPIILAHHDKFDGSGYHSTKGEEIPIEARILSVADVYDALVSDRPYRKGLSPFEARDIILKGEGTDFDPQIIRAFEAAFQKQRLEVSEVLV